MSWLGEYFWMGFGITGWVFFGLAILVGLILDLLGLFGNWVIFGAMAALWAATGFTHFGWLGLGGMLGFALVGEALEMVLAGYGAKKFGGSKASMVAALVGCLLGAIFGTPFIPVPLVGTLIGACLGAFLGAALYDYFVYERNVYDAGWIGFGAALGKVGGLFAKLLCGVLMLVVGVLTW